MAVIFTASGDAGSFRRSSRLVEPMLKFFWPSITPAQIHNTVVAVRTGAHVGEYAILALLLLYGLRAALSVPRWQWNRRAAWLALLLAAWYAGTDEFHQTRTPSRQGAVSDVLLDTVGAGMGLGLAYLVFRYRQRRTRGASPEQGIDEEQLRTQ